jgi:lipopolysaccharide export system protein LptA
MRSLRWLLLVAIAVVAAATFVVYRSHILSQRAHRRPTPAYVGMDTRAEALDWEWGQSDNGKPRVHMTAKHYKQSADEDHAELKGIELRIYMKDGKHFDRVRTDSAQFSTKEKKLYAPGEAEITLDVPADGSAPHQLTSVRAAGVNFNSETGRAVTDKHVAFTFENGDGTCEGASYDPTSHELHLERNVDIHLNGKGPKSKPMRVEAGELTYSESAGVINLGPWSRMSRDQMVINALHSTVKLTNAGGSRRVDWIDAEKGVGTDQQPTKKLDYSADMMHVSYNDDGQMNKLAGTGNARLVSHGDGSDTTMSGDRVDLNFTPTDDGDSVLTSATANGHGNIVSKPWNDPKGLTPDTKILAADVLDLEMRPGGKELERVNTQAPGTLQFVPNQGARHRRVLKAERMTINYGVKNEIQSFHAVNCSTETYPSAADKAKPKPDLEIAYTTSKSIDANFDDKGQLKLMTQTGDFHYAAGARKAQSDVAVLDNARNVMDLEAHAHIADDSGSTLGNHIRLDQATGDFDARGKVSTTRLPDQKKNASDMLDQDEPTQGTADRVVSAEHNHLIHYIGNAVLWQTSNRISANTIDVNRDKKTLVADGQVVSQFIDDKSKGDKSAAAKPIFTVIKAQHMVYTDQDRLAYYTGGANLWRPTLTVKSATLRAFLNPENSDSDSRINKAYGDGNVEIVQLSADRTRVGTGQHGEYYTDDGKIVLNGGSPQLKDTLKGDTRGEQLVYFTDDDRLIVSGAPKNPVQSHLHRRKS